MWHKSDTEEQFVLNFLFFETNIRELLAETMPTIRVYSIPSTLAKSKCKFHLNQFCTFCCYFHTKSVRLKICFLSSREYLEFRILCYHSIQRLLLLIFLPRAEDNDTWVIIQKDTDFLLLHVSLATASEHRKLEP
jgi:hypothetical protein